MDSNFSKRPRIMLLHNDESKGRQLSLALDESKWSCQWVPTLSEAFLEIKRLRPDVVVWHPSSGSAQSLCSMGVAPVLAVVLPNDVVMRSKLVSWGIGDMIGEPVNHAEFVWRLQRLLRGTGVGYEQNPASKEHSEIGIPHQDMSPWGQLAAEISHKLRSPLGTLRTSLFTIQQRNERGDERVSSAVGRAERGISRVVTILDDFLGYCRPEGLNFVSTEMDTWLKGNGRSLAHDEGVRLQVEANCNTSILLDRTAFLVCLRRLLRNSAQAMAHFPLEKRLVLLKCVKSEEQVLLEVSDRGVGLSPEQFDLAFQPLYAADTGRLGLGLSIVRQIVEQHGGDVHFATQTAPGCTIRLRMPIDGQSRSM